MERKKSTVWIVIVLALLLLFSSSYIAINSSCFQTVEQDILVAVISQKENLLNSDKQSFVQIVTEDGFRILSSVGSASRFYISDKKEDNFNFYSIFAILFKVAVIPGFLLTGSLFGAELRGTSSQNQIIKFIHNTDGKK